MIGFKFGGPLGAAIGAGVGALAGTIRLFVKGAEEKLIEKVKAVYGIKIDRGFARDPLLGIIKQSFGGNIDVGIRSPQVRDLIELYAMSTGQQPGGGFTPQMQPISLVQRGGSITQSPTFQNGALLAPAGRASTPIIQTVVLDPDATRDFWETQTLRTVAGNPGAVQAATITAQSRNIGRRESAAQMFSPSLVTA